MSLTTDRNDPGLKDHRPDGQQKAYLILSEEERAKGFVRPVRTSYVHSRGKCGGVATRMSRELGETYARDPYFYSGTFCVGCGGHFPVAEFDWEDGSVVGS